MAKKKVEDEFVSIGYAALRLKVYPGTVRKYFDRGILIGRKLPLGRRQISRSSLDELANRLAQGNKVQE